MTVVWISDTNYHKILRTLSLNFSKNYCSFEKLYPKLHSVFHPISRHLEVGFKNFFNPLLSVWISDETLRVVLDILPPQWFVYLPSLAVPEECIKVDAAATSLFRRDGPYITQLFEGNYFSNAARSRITTNLQQEVRDYVNTFMYPEDYTLTESISKTDCHSNTLRRRRRARTTVKMSASESCIRLKKNVKNKSRL